MSNGEMSSSENSNNQNQLPVEIRALIDSDIPFIFNSWLKAFRNAKAVTEVNQTIYFSQQHKLIEKLLQRGQTLIIGAAGDPATVYGYVNFEHIDGVFVLHFGYVKHDFRGLGLFRELMKATKHDFSGLGCYSHKVRANGLLEDKFNLVFNPYVLINY